MEQAEVSHNSKSFPFYQKEMKDNQRRHKRRIVRKKRGRKMPTIDEVPKNPKEQKWESMRQRKLDRLQLKSVKKFDRPIRNQIRPEEWEMEWEQPKKVKTLIKKEEPQTHWFWRSLGF